MSKWTVSNVNRLKELWGTGKTAREIAEILGPEFSRNSVIGRAFRMNLSSKLRKKKIDKNLNNKDNFQSSIKKGRKSKFRSLLIANNFEPAKNLTLEELTEETCKYMDHNMHPNEPNATFCGRKTVRNSKQKFSYCPLHLMIIFQPKVKKEDPVDKDDEISKYIIKKIKSA